MAHECPECGLMCYCGGDIDDLCLNDEDDVIHCTHYKKRDCDGYEMSDDEYDEYMDSLVEGGKLNGGS